MNRTHRAWGAFTLIELLVVISIIALLMGILLPSLGEARREAQRVVSQVNLRSLVQIQTLYTGEHAGSWVNPFNEDDDGAFGCGRWNAIRNPLGPGCFIFGGPQPFATEMYAAHWYSLTANWISEGDYASDVQFSPADDAPRQRMLDLISDPDFSIGLYIWDTSYFYSPTFWSNPDRFTGTTRAPMIKDTLRRNLISDVSFPSRKVILFERFDVSQKRRIESRSAGGFSLTFGRRDAPPNWNNPGARPSVALSDGSVTRPAISDLLELMTSSKQSVQEAFTPAGIWDVPQSYLERFEMAQDGLENGSSVNPGAYPAFFWATKNGIKGRDLNR